MRRIVSVRGGSLRNHLRGTALGRGVGCVLSRESLVILVDKDCVALFQLAALA